MKSEAFHSVQFLYSSMFVPYIKDVIAISETNQYVKIESYRVTGRCDGSAIAAACDQKRM
jgi:hypothetical protein